MQRIATCLFTLFILCSVNATSHAEPDAVDAKVTGANYVGWAVLKRRVIDADAPEEDWISMRDIKMNDGGSKLQIVDGEQATPYTIELIEITYTETNTTVLKLALYEEGKDKAITYIWGQPDAERLGMNLRWFQVGLTKAE